MIDQRTVICSYAAQQPGHDLLGYLKQKGLAGDEKVDEGIQARLAGLDIRDHVSQYFNPASVRPPHIMGTAPTPPLMKPHQQHYHPRPSRGPQSMGHHPRATPHYQAAQSMGYPHQQYYPAMPSPYMQIQPNPMMHQSMIPAQVPYYHTGFPQPQPQFIQQQYYYSPGPVPLTETAIMQHQYWQQQDQAYIGYAPTSVPYSRDGFAPQAASFPIRTQSSISKQRQRSSSQLQFLPVPVDDGAKSATELDSSQTNPVNTDDAGAVPDQVTGDHVNDELARQVDEMFRLSYEAAAKEAAPQDSAAADEKAEASSIPLFNPVIPDHRALHLPPWFSNLNPTAPLSLGALGHVPPSDREPSPPMELPMFNPVAPKTPSPVHSAHADSQ